MALVAGDLGAAHLANLALGLAGLAKALEAGVLLGAAYMLTRDLWLPIGIHWAWNLFEGPIYGTAVSGSSSTSLLTSVTTGPTLWTGGAFGPEAGLVAVALADAAGHRHAGAGGRRGRLITPAWIAPPPGHSAGCVSADTADAACALPQVTA